MKRLCFILALSFIVSGCVNSKIQDPTLPSKIQNQLQIIKEGYPIKGTNMKKKFYSYYLPQGIGRRGSNELSEIFIKDGYQLVMNIDPSSTIIEKFYTKKAEELLQQTVAIKQDEQHTLYEGTYQILNDKRYRYKLNIVPDGSNIVLYFDGEIVKFYAILPQKEVVSMTKVIFKIASSLQLNESNIINHFSMKSLEESKKRSLEYLEKNIPTNGSLNELIYGDEKEPTHQSDTTE